MYCTGRLFVDDTDYAMMRCKISIPGYKINNVGTVLAPPSAPSFTIKIESRQESNFHRWINDIQIKDHVKLKFSSVNMDGQSKTFDLYDVRCVRNYESFDSNAADPMSNAITLIPGILVAEGVLLRVQKWKIQDPAVIMGQVAPTVIEQPEQEKDVEESFEDIYLLDENNQALKEIDKPQNVTLVIKTKGKVGKTISSIEFNNEEYSFKHEGKTLNNDSLSGFKITKDEERIPLEVIEQTNQN